MAMCAGLIDQVLVTVGLGDYLWVDLEFSLIKSFKKVVHLFKTSTHSPFVSYRFSKRWSTHPNHSCTLRWERDSCCHLWNVTSVGAWVTISEFKLLLPFSLCSHDGLFNLTETPKEAFTNEEALFMMWGFLFFFLRSNSLWWASELQSFQRAKH